MPLPRLLSRRPLLLGAAAAALLPWGLAAQPARGGGAAAGAGRLSVLATTAMVGDLARRIGGDRIALEVLMGEGVDPHLYKPTREDVAKLLRAGLVLYSGLLLEGKMTDAFTRIARTGRPVVAVAESLPREALLAAEGAEGHPDPHVWMDVSLWSQVATRIAQQLKETDPAGAATYDANLAALRQELEALDGWARQAIASIPAPQRVLVTAHDAFNYFSRRYGIEVMGIQGLSTESEAGLRRIEELVGILVERRIPAVFVESSVSDRNVRALVEGAAARGHRVVIGGELFSDAMGAPGSYEGTYPGMIDHNVTVITRALGGQAPSRGFSGRLAGIR